MLEITYERPTIVESEHKPFPMAGKPFPYNQLADSRRFEELMYSIYSNEIKQGFLKPFDDIAIMTGVGEMGRDCVLFRGGKQYGLIQCKKYKNPYGKDEFGSEITKFVLYALLNKELIYDADDFTYYIVASTGFANGCPEFIADFNNLIADEPKLQTWIDTNIKAPTLKSFELGAPYEHVKHILTKIKVIPIRDIDIDLLLVRPTNVPVIPLFFQYRAITDNSEIEKLRKEIQQLLEKRLDSAQLVMQLCRASITVKSQRNEFEGITDSNIPRNETEQLYTWLTSAPRKDKEGYEENICLLAGNAGMGKTVIIKDLYERLLSEEIPTLALKADKLYAGSINDLQHKIGLSIPVFDFIDQCKQNFPKVVLLIDQIDALSQSLSADRSFLNTYANLIDTYKYDPMVRIIISVRLFDLYYDPGLKVYKDIKSIEVKKLNKESVIAQIQKIGIWEKNISNSLLELLQTPNNLDVFSRIYNKSLNFAGINSIQDLYQELWSSKVLAHHNAPSQSPTLLTEVLFAISDKMYQSQQINVSAQLFELHHRELIYLQTERLIKIDENGIQFFHQSFYDFVFAKRFVQENRSIELFIKKENQSIMVRSALKMIINHLREYNPDFYIKQLRSLLLNRKWYFHIKHLLISTLAGLEKPTAAEYKLVDEKIMHHPVFSETFFEHVIGQQWIAFLIARGHLDGLLDPPALKKDNFFQRIINQIKKKKITETAVVTARRQNILFSLLRRNLHSNTEDILRILVKIDNNDFVFRILYNLRDWSDSRALTLFDKCTAAIDSKHWGYYHLLEEIAAFHPVYVFDKVKDTLLIESQTRDTNQERRKIALLKILFDKIPDVVSHFFLGKILSDIVAKQRVDYFSDLLNDNSVGGIDLQDDDDHLGHEFLFKLLALNLRQQAKYKTCLFTDFLKANIDTRFKSILKLIVFSLQTNESLYPNDIHTLILRLSRITFFDNSGKLNYEIRRLLKEAYPHFDKSQQEEINRFIKNLIVKREIYSHVNPVTLKKKFYSQWGRTKLFFIRTLPAHVISGDREYKRILQELTRTQGDWKDIYRGNGITAARMSHAPLSSNAYRYMKKDDWIRSFKMYTGERGDHEIIDENFFKGGISEHAQAFANATVQAPEKHFEIIEEIVEDGLIPIAYVIKGIEGLIQVDYRPDQTLTLLKKLIRRDIDDSNMYSTIYAIDKIVDRNNFDEEVINFLIYQALNNFLPDRSQPEPEPSEYGDKTVQDYARSGLHTPRGMAARILLNITDARYADKIFNTLQQLFATDITIVRAGILSEYAYLLNLNAERACNSFVEIVSDLKNEHILTASFWSLQYMIHRRYEQLVPLFKKLISMVDLEKEDQNWIAGILFGAWLNDYQGAENLYKGFIIKNSYAQERAVHDAIENVYYKDELSIKSLGVLEMLINLAEKKVNKKFEIEFLHMEHIKFEDLYGLILKYVQSKNFVMTEYFLEFLTNHSSKFPCETIDLFETAIRHENIGIEEDGNIVGSEDMATIFIIGAYSSLRPSQNRLHKKYQTKLLKAFDQVLIDSRFRSNAESVLEKVIA